MNKNQIRMILDISMTVLYLFLMFGYSLSPLAHEILGILVGVLFIAHFVLNYAMYKGLLKGHKLKGEIKVVTDMMLLIAMPIVIFSGVLISRSLLNLDFNNTIYVLHIVSSKVVLLTLGVHVAMHMKFMVTIIKLNLFKKPTNKTAFTTIN